MKKIDALLDKVRPRQIEPIPIHVIIDYGGEIPDEEYSFMLEPAALSVR